MARGPDYNNGARIEQRVKMLLGRSEFVLCLICRFSVLTTNFNERVNCHERSVIASDQRIDV